MESFSTWTSSRFADPLPVKEGIRNSLGTRGGREPGWWSAQWINLVQRSNIGVRIERAKYYASLGQVFSIEIFQGRIQAQVQGALPEPYRVYISMPPVPTARWSFLLETVLNFQICVRLFSGELPLELANMAKESAGIDIIPEDFQSFHSKCTCPDWSNPCKHIAAVHMLVAYEIDRDPLLLLKFRGIDKEALIDCLRNWFNRHSKPKFTHTLRTANTASSADRTAASPLPESDPEVALSRVLADPESTLLQPASSLGLPEMVPGDSSGLATVRDTGSVIADGINHEEECDEPDSPGDEYDEDDRLEAQCDEFDCTAADSNELTAFLEGLLTGGAFRKDCEAAPGSEGNSKPSGPSPESFWEGLSTPVSTSAYFDSVRMKGYSTMKECLGRFPFWRSVYDFDETLDTVYSRAAVYAHNSELEI